MSRAMRHTIGDILYRKRKEYDLNQNDMAEKCCISPRQYSDIENGKRLPSLKTFINIAIICDIDLNSMIDEIVEKGYKVAGNQEAK